MHSIYLKIKLKLLFPILRQNQFRLSLFMRSGLQDPKYIVSEVCQLHLDIAHERGRLLFSLSLLDQSNSERNIYAIELV